ncbi:hypothetical protein [Sphingomonas melonis]|uniref:Uncharacterized protein n=1 Tax=Sphingomonas melonis TaxID=152682 RepID=A0A7Y9FKK5_9SPHN|nr:hypothetical protein [Sphingomonas melonis]NYD88737.1 hypothetical protein [Sphingomonas melonis]
MKILDTIWKAVTGKTAVAVASTILTQAVAAAAQRGNPIGNAAHSAVAAIENTTLSGSEKKAHVIAAIVPVIIAEARKGGTAVVNDVEQFAGMVVEEVVAQFKQTSLLSIALSILRSLGLK